MQSWCDTYLCSESSETYFSATPVQHFQAALIQDTAALAALQAHLSRDSHPVPESASFFAHILISIYIERENREREIEREAYSTVVTFQIHN
jgi:hypothetical protein